MSDLQHFGIKGMHWGVRRQRAADGKVRGPSKSTREGVSSDAARAHEARAKVKSHGLDSLSNQDLQHLVSRMNLEQQYSRLTSDKTNVAKVKKGRNAIKEVIGVAIMAKQVHEIVNSPMVKDIKVAVGKTKKGG